jgi:hypothetical protein
METKRRGPEFEPIADKSGCEAHLCLRTAKYVAKWPFVVKRVCDQHKAEVDGEPWDAARPTFRTSMPPT